jgi:hypothetical protein
MLKFSRLAVLFLRYFSLTIQPWTLSELPVLCSLARSGFKAVKYASQAQISHAIQLMLGRELLDPRIYALRGAQKLGLGEDD